MGGKSCKACEACDSPVVELAEFGQTSDQDGRQGRADSGNGGEAAAVLGECGAGVDLGNDLPLDRREVRLQNLEQSRNFPRDPGIPGGACAVLLAPDAGYEVVTASDEIGQPRPVWIDGRGRSGGERPAHSGEDFGIDPVGLGQPASGAGELASLTGVDPGAGGSRLV